MGRSRSRTPPRRERRRSRSTSRDRERKRRERERSRSRDRERRRSRSRSPHRRRSRSPPRRHRSSSSHSDRRDDERKDSKEKTVKPIQISEEDMEGKTEEEIEMMKLMGFGSFETSKGRKTDGSVNAFAINVSMKRKYRQYMNRKEAEHGYASMPPFTSSQERESLKRKSKSKKNTSSRRANLRLCLERLKSLVPLGPDANRHTTLSLLMKARDHIKRLEESDRRAQHTVEQLQRERRHLRRRLEQLGVERTRMDSTGSNASDKSDSDQEDLDVDVEGTDYLLGDLEWSTSSVSDSGDERGSLRSSCSDEGYSSASLLLLQDTQERAKQIGCSL
uniref:MAX dimerization protein 1 n=1 Tax=Gasterosteus aculeatus aculeatus TaxID=481459 RepID=A0AAQ4S2Q9_GASAC